jgi:hypothetical protein
MSYKRYLNNKNYELHAYDKLALCFYYSGQQEKAQILHNKAMDGKVEPSKTRVRVIIILFNIEVIWCLKSFTKNN